MTNTNIRIAALSMPCIARSLRAKHPNLPAPRRYGNSPDPGPFRPEAAD